MFRGLNTTIILILAALALTLFLIVALALDAPTSYVYEKAKAQKIHGGYAMNGDICEQCHDINNSSGNFVLSRWRTVTDICGSCHYLYTEGPPRYRDRFNPPGNSAAADDGEHSLRNTSDDNYQSSIFTDQNIPYKLKKTETAAPAEGAGTSVGAPSSAYEYRSPTSRSLGEHGLQRGPGRWLYSDKPDNFQGADYVPGGTARLRSESGRDYAGNFGVLNYAAAPRDLSCGSCHIPHGDAGPRLFLRSGGLPSAATILAMPRILQGSTDKEGRRLSSLTINGSWGTDGGRWCAECHNRLFDDAVDPVDGSALHNHPDFACLTCHADAVNDPGDQPNTDFPHTGYNPNLLAYDEDSLCVTCHVPGSIP